ncbi:MAG TPA: hypothetical protein VMS08_05295 [Candidatus Saccharimonadia bacterium]|jgi:hypothetical protein|nr:hypothetical protein [Candidatus Saccharimonadia bacterium]
MSKQKGCGKECLACQISGLRDLRERLEPNMSNECVGALRGELDELIFNLRDIASEQNDPWDGQEAV